MRCLLTGATGFVGRNFLLEAVRQGRYRTIVVPVRNLERFRAQCRGDGFDDIPSIVEPFEAEAPHWDFTAFAPFDHVVHCAGVLAASSREDYFRINVQGTVRLVETLAGAPRMVVLSSQAASGPSPSGKTMRDEVDPPDPLTGYGESKLEMERELLRRFPAKALLFLRPPMVLGPRDRATLPLFQIVRSPLRPRVGLRPKQYSFIAVDDLVRAIFAALEAGDRWASLDSKSYFVAHADAITDEQLLATCGRIARRVGVTVPIPTPLVVGLSRVVERVGVLRERIPNLRADRVRELLPERWVVSTRAFENAFRWKATTSLEKTLAETEAWYRKTGQL
jgi:nucleoside-diphosphate-sugar epimerase